MAATPTSVITDAVGDMKGDLLTVAGVGIGIGAAVLVLRKGWKTVKGFF